MGSIYLKIDDELDEHITTLAQEKGAKKTDVLRDLLESGLASQQVKQDLAIVEKERDGLKVKVSDLEKEHSEFMTSMTQEVDRAVAKALKAYDSRLQDLGEALGGTQKIVIERLTGFKEAIERLEKGHETLPGVASEKPSEHASSGKPLGETLERHLPECKDCRESAFEALKPFMQVQDVETCVDCHKPYESKTEEGPGDLLTGELQKRQVCMHCGSDSEPKEGPSQIVLLESARKEEPKLEHQTEPEKPELSGMVKKEEAKESESKEHEYEPLI